MIKGLRVFQPLKKLSSIFDVGLNIGNLGIENIGKSTFAQKTITHNPHALAIFIILPYFPKPGNSS